jgi:hypothetical protein
MIRLNLRGRPSRVLRPEELAESVRILDRDAPDEAPRGPHEIEWLSPAGIVLERRTCASLRELVSLIAPALDPRRPEGPANA